MTRVLPGVYGSIFDMSQLPEGQQSLTVGYTLACNKGTVGEPFLVTSPTDFLQKTTFDGKPPVKGDPTFITILEVLQNTRQVYISRVTKNPLYGGLVVKRDKLVAERILETRDISVYDRVTKEVTKPAGEIVIKGELKGAVTIGDTVRVYGTDKCDGKYIVTELPTEDGNGNTVITVGQSMAQNETLSDDIVTELYVSKQPKPITDETVGVLVGADKTEQTLKLLGDVEKYILAGDKIAIKKGDLKGEYVVDATDYDADENTTTVVVRNEVNVNYNKETTGEDIEVFRHSISNPDAYAFKDEDLFLVYGKDQGKYNGDIDIQIVSSADTPDKLTESDVMEITAINHNTGLILGGTFMCSRDREAKSIAGEPLYIEQVINGNSEYIRVKNNEEVDETELPCNTTDNIMNTDGKVTGVAKDYILKIVDGTTRMGGGDDGETITKGSTDAFISALEVFKNKTVPISLMGNGWCEEADYQQRLINIVEGRLDCFQFLNSRLKDEKAQNTTQRAQNIVDYKKKELGSTSYMATMYAPHVKMTDVINQCKREVGAEAVAIPGWLNIINTKNYPYAYAGYADGKVTGATCDWKIGDTSGEAELLNDASVNYIAYDAKDGVYYMQCQNTLQIANSSLRNVGTTLNVLDIKENFMRYFKQFLQQPITSMLRKRILDGGNRYMRTVKSAERISAFSLMDVATDYDIANNTLRYLLVISPTPYAQKIYIVMNIVNQTFDFSIYQSAS